MAEVPMDDSKTEQIEVSSELMMHEYDIRMLNNEIFEIMNRVHITLDDLRRLDELQAKKAQLALVVSTKTYPAASATIRAMTTVLGDEDQDADVIARLQEMLQDIVDELALLDMSSPDAKQRSEELKVLIETSEKILVAHVTERRSAQSIYEMLE